VQKWPGNRYLINQLPFQSNRFLYLIKSISRVLVMEQVQLLQDIKNQLEHIRAHAEAQTNLISGASTYAMGYAISFGMNWALGQGLLGSGVLALLSWVNVGYVLVKYVGHITN
jgi:hypothetical protein